MGEEEEDDGEKEEGRGERERSTQNRSIEGFPEPEPGREKL